MDEEPLIDAFNSAILAHAVQDGKVNLTEVMVAAAAVLTAYIGQLAIEDRRAEFDKLTRVLTLGLER